MPAQTTATRVKFYSQWDDAPDLVQHDPSDGVQDAPVEVVGAVFIDDALAAVHLLHVVELHAEHDGHALVDSRGEEPVDLGLQELSHLSPCTCQILRNR